MPSQEELRVMAKMQEDVAREEALAQEARWRDHRAGVLGHPVALTPYVFGADSKRRLLFLVNWPPAPDKVVTLPMLNPAQAARVGGSWEPRLMEAYADGGALALWQWVPDVEPEATP